MKKIVAFVFLVFLVEFSPISFVFGHLGLYAVQHWIHAQMRSPKPLEYIAMHVKLTLQGGFEKFQRPCWI